MSVLTPLHPSHHHPGGSRGHDPTTQHGCAAFTRSGDVGHASPPGGLADAAEGGHQRFTVASRCDGIVRVGPVAAAGRGFTLVELMVVIVIIGLLATVVMINVMPSQDRAMIEKARADVAVLEQAVETYRLENLVYPTSAQGLDALLTAPAGLARPQRYRRGGYIRRLPTDPWGNPYQYARPGRQSAYDIYSFGADGVAGGEGNAADIGNWR